MAYTNKYVGYNVQVQQTQQNQHVIGMTSPILWALNKTDTDPPRFQYVFLGNPTFYSTVLLTCDQRLVVPDPGSGLVLDLYGGYSKDGTLVQLYPNHGGDNQIWKVEPVSS